MAPALTAERKPAYCPVCRQLGWCEPLPNGKMALIAVEYITSKGPASLKGQLFNFNGAPNRYGLGPFYELHVWAWKANPHGAFADMNPNVTCEHASADKPAAN